MNTKKLNRLVILAFGSQAWIRTYHDDNGKFFRIMHRCYYADDKGATRRETFHRVTSMAFKSYRAIRCYCHQLTRPTHQYRKDTFIVS